MGEPKGTENLVAARDILRSSLERSKDIALAIEKTGPKLAKSSQQLTSLTAAIQTVAMNCALYEVRGHVDRAVGPAAAVLKVFDLVHELETSLLAADPCVDLFGYLTTVKRLEEALQLLTANCGLLILWLDDLRQFLEDKKYADNWYLWNVKKSLKICRELQATEEQCCRNGVLIAAIHKLENEFRSVLMEISFPTMTSSLPHILKESYGPPVPSVSPPLIQKVQAIIGQLAANDCMDKCICTYAEVRGSKARAALECLAPDYLDLSLSEFDSVQTIEDYTDQWVRHLEITVKHLLEIEYRLCQEVFKKAGYDAWMDCFAKVALLSGICDLLSFGNSVAKGKKEAVKLLKLLEIFAALNNLRLDFNRLFNGKSCLEIQNGTRDLIKNVVNGACEIFRELPIQVELERNSSPSADGSVPRMVGFVIDFCNQLLEDDYLSVLIQILEIHRGWSRETFDKELVLVEVRNIIKALELNVNTWASAYNDTNFSYLFLMNNHWYFCKNVSGTKLEDLMGSFWLSEHEAYIEYYATIYLKENWGKLPMLLSDEGLILFPGGRAIDHNLLKKRLQAFTEAFEDMYKKQSNWILSDESLRSRMFQLILQTVVHPYKRYMHKYIPNFIEYEMDANKYVKYTAATLENMITSLFQPKIGNCNTKNCTDFVDKVTSLVAPHHISSTPAAA